MADFYRCRLLLDSAVGMSGVRVFFPFDPLPVSSFLSFLLLLLLLFSFEATGKRNMLDSSQRGGVIE